MLTLIVSDFFSSLQVTILSPNGTDLTPSIPILHSNIPFSTLQQRSPTTTHIQDCPVSDPNISSSWCQRAHSPQAFGAFCKEPWHADQTDPQSFTHYTQGRCAPDEICVGGQADDVDTPLQAYCVSTNHFVQIGRDPSSGSGQQNHPDSSGVVTAGFNPTTAQINNESQLAVEALVTSLDKTTMLSVTSIVMQAQTYSKVWRTVADNNGHDYCLGCSRLNLAPFPATARRVKVDVVMPDSTPTGLLWLASYPYGEPALLP